MVRHKKSAALGPLQKQVLYLSLGALWITGAYWLYDQQSLCLKLHGAAAMVFLMIFGVLVVDHALTGWGLNDKRPSGGSVLAVCGILVLTGWGLYYVGGEDLRHWISLIHRVLGLLLPVIILIHVHQLPKSEAVKKSDTV
jgi:hypothetical protein